MFLRDVRLLLDCDEHLGSLALMIDERNDIAPVLLGAKSVWYGVLKTTVVIIVVVSWLPLFVSYIPVSSLLPPHLAFGSLPGLNVHRSSTYCDLANQHHGEKTSTMLPLLQKQGQSHSILPTTSTKALLF